MKHAALAILTTLSLVACKPQDPKPLPAEAMAPAVGSWACRSHRVQSFSLLRLVTVFLLPKVLH